MGSLLRWRWHRDVQAGAEVEQNGHDALIAPGVRIVSGTVASLVVENDRLVGVTLADGSVVAHAALFVRPRFAPHDRLAIESSCASDESGSGTKAWTALMEDESITRALDQWSFVRHDRPAGYA